MHLDVWFSSWTLKCGALSSLWHWRLETTTKWPSPLCILIQVCHRLKTVWTIAWWIQGRRHSKQVWISTNISTFLLHDVMWTVRFHIQAYISLHCTADAKRVQYKLCRDSSSVSSVRSSKVPRRLLRASLRSFWPPTSPFGQPSQTEYSSVSSQHIWHPVFQSCRSDGLELTACLIHCAIRPSSLNVLGGTWKRISLLDIRDKSALAVSLFHGIAL